MAQYQSDLQDINFNLFDVYKIQDTTDLYEANDLKDILREFDKFTANEIFPTREEGDQVGVELTDDGVKVPKCFHKANKSYYENGWYGLGYPEEIGGIPAPVPFSLAANSILTGANVAFAMYPGLSKGTMNVILKVGSQEQKDRDAPNYL